MSTVFKGMIDVQEAASYLGISVDHTRRLATAGDIPSHQFKKGSTRFFYKSELLPFLRLKESI